MQVIGRCVLFDPGKQLVVLLCGGDKRGQNNDIKAAIVMAGQLDD